MNEKEKQLWNAVYKGDLPLVKSLFDKGLSPKIYKEFYGGNSLLDLACYSKRFEVIRLLLASGFELPDPKSDPLRALANAYEGDDEQIAKMMQELVSVGAEFKKLPKGYDDALHYAAMYGLPRCCQLLIALGAEVNAKGQYGRLPLNYAVAAQQNSLECTEVILAARPNLKLKNDGNENALFELITSDNGLAEVAALLLKKGVPVVTKGKYQNTALHWAVFCKRYEVLEEILKFGVEVDTLNDKKETALSVVLSNNNFKMAKLLIEYGADVDKGVRYGNSILEATAEKGNFSMFKYVLTKSDKYINNAFIAALSNGKDNIIQYIFDQGYAFAPEVLGKALGTAAYNNREKWLKLLLQKGADLNFRDGRGNDALQQAAWAGHLSIVELLVKQGAEVNSHNNYNWTPLMQACSEKKTKIVEFLLNNGATTHDVDKEFGDTALTIAKKVNAKAIIELLEAHGAQARSVDMRKDGEALFAIQDCQVCAYLEENKDYGRTEKVPDFEGLEVLESSSSTDPDDRYVDYLNKLLQCKNCGTVYYYNLSIDTEDAFIAGPGISNEYHRINYQKTIDYFESLPKYKQHAQALKEHRKHLIPQIEALISSEQSLNPNFKTYLLDCLCDDYLNANDWTKLSQLLKKIDKSDVLAVLKRLICIHEEKGRETKSFYKSYINYSEEWRLRILPFLSEQIDKVLKFCKPWKDMSDWDERQLNYLLASTSFQQLKKAIKDRKKSK